MFRGNLARYFSTALPFPSRASIHKTITVAHMIKRPEELLLQQMGRSLEEHWALERDYTRNVVRDAKAEEAFPEFIARKGRPLPPQKP